MKRILLNLLGMLTVGVPLSLYFSATLAAGAASTPLTTFANPSPAVSGNFGRSVAALGSDLVLIGASRDAAGPTYAGAVYLFNTNGVLLTTFLNPTLAAADFFGESVAALGTDRVLVGAVGDDTSATNAGAAYLFSTNGVLLTTITNPTPGVGDLFGVSVAALGTDLLLIGAAYDDTDANGAGTAYLFSTNGELLTTFAKRTPAIGDTFGSSVAAAGTDRVLIAALHDDTGTNDAGAVYLFGTNGVLLTTFTNPTPAAGDLFGNSVAALGTDRVLIGAPGDDTGAADAGAAYLFSLTACCWSLLPIPPPQPVTGSAMP